MCAMLFSTRSAEGASIWTSNVSGSVGVEAAPMPGAAGTGQAQEIRVGLEALRIQRVVDGHRSPQQQRGHGAGQRQIRVDDRLETLRIADAHLLAGRRQVDIAGLKPFSPTRPLKVTSPLASRARKPSMRMPPASNAIWPLIASSECGSASWRIRPSVIAALPEKTGLSSGPVICALSDAAAGAADVAEEALQDAEVRITGCLDVDGRLVEIDVAVDRQLGALAEQPETADVDHVLIEIEEDHIRSLGAAAAGWRRRRPRRVARAAIAQLVVEQLEIELLDAGVDRQVIDVSELTDHSDRAAGDGTGKRRELRGKETQIRIERGVGEPERQLGVHLVGHRDPAGAGHDESG